MPQMYKEKNVAKKKEYEKKKAGTKEKLLIKNGFKRCISISAKLLVALNRRPVLHYDLSTVKCVIIGITIYKNGRLILSETPSLNLFLLIPLEPKVTNI